MRFMSFTALLMAVSTIAPVSTPAPACSSYAIEGALEPPANGQWEFTATAYLHDGSESLPNHRVFAVPTMSADAPMVEPIELVTDADGRASIMLPVGAEGVRFMSESPAAGDCTGSPDVVTTDVSVPVIAAALPVTGVPDWLVTVAVVPLTIGLGVVIGRGRRRGRSRTRREPS
jgi:hypothetical protein